MKKFKWRKWNRAIHRDLGYLSFALTVIYSISGIAINHINDWNPNYIITHREISYKGPTSKEQINKGTIFNFLENINEAGTYKKHYFPNRRELKIFIDGGNVIVDLNSRQAYLEKISRRPLIHAMNYLHYNPGKWWTIYSDIFAGALILLAFTGLFIIRGKNGITRRGAVLTIAGILLPVLYLVFFYG